MPPSCSHVIFSVLCFAPPFFYQYRHPSKSLPSCLAILLALSLVSACFAWFQLPPFSLFFIRTLDCFPWLGRKNLSLLYAFYTLPSPFGSPVQNLSPASLEILIMAKLVGPFDSRCIWACGYHVIASLYHPSFHLVIQAPKFPALNQNKPSFCCCFHLFRSCSWECLVETSHNCWVQFQPERSENRLITVAM